MKGMSKPAKSMGNHQAEAEGTNAEMASVSSNMGARPMSAVPANSNHGYPHRPTPKPDKVREVAHDQGALKKARMFNERSENGGADPSAYPCGK